MYLDRSGGRAGTGARGGSVANRGGDGMLSGNVGVVGRKVASL